MRDRLLCRLLAVIVGACIAGTTGSAQSIIYVDVAATGANDGLSWGDAYVYLQEALAEAGPAAKPIEIRVAQGVYTPIDRNSPFELLNGVTLKGGYAGAVAAEPDLRDPARHETVLSGDINGDDGSGPEDRYDNSVQVVLAVETDTTAVIDGFTVVGACREGMVVENGSASIQDCTFEDNAYGLQTLESSGLTLANCRFSKNAWAGIYGWDCQAVLTGCTFEANGTMGVTPAVYCPNDDGSPAVFRPSHLVLTDCLFCENDGGGLYVGGGVDLTRCTFTGNRDSEAVHCSGTMTARGCSFVANEDGAISCRDDVLPPSRMAPECTLTDCEFISNVADRIGHGGALSTDGNTLTVTRCVFAGNEGGSYRSGAGAIVTQAKVLRLSHCTFTGNKIRRRNQNLPLNGTGAVLSDAVLSLISNCTFSGNRGKVNAFKHERTQNAGSRAVFTQCIVREGDTSLAGNVSVTYSNVEGGYEGQGNINVDPCFVAPGYWDANDTPDDYEDDFWVIGDYHLKSQAGHWDSDSEDWVRDEVTSPCIDLGDPNGPLGDEPFPSGGFINLGAYGGTAEASRSYFGGLVCETQIAGDINGDCKVDDLDMDILMSHWLMPDIGKANVPPSITIISPEDGAELTEPTPIVLRAETSVSDGTLLEVQYYLTHDRNITYLGAGLPVADPADDWVYEYDWSSLRHDGVYELWAEAIDDDGALSVSPTITITLHPGQ